MSFGLIINHNLGSMNALAALNQNQNSLQSMLQQLSTGKQINSSSDNAAGFAISQKMQNQINGLDQASQNSQDGISLLQTANGALNETQSILQRMRQLAVQSANDTNTSSDRSSLQDEVNQLSAEIDNIANTTQFNTKNLLNGGAGVDASVTGDAAGAVTVVGGTSATTKGAVVDITAAGVAAATGASYTGGTSLASALASAGTLNINGTTFSFNTGATQTQIINTINNANIGVTATASGNNIKYTTTAVGSSASLSVTGGGALSSDATASTKHGTDASITAGDLTDGTNNLNYTVSGNTFTISDATHPSANGLSFTIDPTKIASDTSVSITVNSNNSLEFQIGANQNQTMAVSINSMSSGSLGVSNLDITSQTGAENAISSIDNAISVVSNQQAELGAYQNRLQDTINNVDTASQNLTTAQSAITDTNMASAMANFTKDNVLQQAAISMLAQANQQPQLVLKLLG